MLQTNDEQIAFMDLDATWHLLGRIASGAVRHTYFQYGSGRQRALIILHGLRRDQVLRQRVLVHVEDDAWGPVVQVLSLVSATDEPREQVQLVSALIREAYAQRGGSRRGRPHRRTLEQ